MEHRKEGRRERTFCLFDAPHVGAELVHRLDILLKLVAIEHDPSSGLQRRDPVLEDHRPDRDARVHRVRGKVEMADRAGVDAAALALEGRDELDRADLGRAGDGACGEDGPEGGEPASRVRRAELISGRSHSSNALRPSCARARSSKNGREKRDSPILILAEHPADLTRQVHDVRELFDLHERVDDDRLGAAHAVDVVPREVDEHDVLGAVLDRGGQLRGELGVLCEGIERRVRERLRDERVERQESGR